MYIHAGYDSQHNVLDDLVEIDISSGALASHALSRYAELIAYSGIHDPTHTVQPT